MTMNKGPKYVGMRVAQAESIISETMIKSIADTTGDKTPKEITDDVLIGLKEAREALDDAINEIEGDREQWNV